MNIAWNANSYTNHFSFVHKYGEDVLKLIDAPAGSRVLDLGCGNGALTKKLQELGFQAQGMDASEDMLTVARLNHPGIRFDKGDATRFMLPEPADVIFSNAVFHWIDREKQDALAAVFIAEDKHGRKEAACDGRHEHSHCDGSGEGVCEGSALRHCLRTAPEVFAR